LIEPMLRDPGGTGLVRGVGGVGNVLPDGAASGFGKNGLPAALAGAVAIVRLTAAQIAAR